jgi:hypothetical protein
MVKTLTAYIREPDSPARVAASIAEQLNLKENRLKNSFALIFHHKYFHKTKVFRAIYKTLNMETLGIASSMLSASGAYGEILTVMVLTSDDVEFVSGLSAPIFANYEILLSELYHTTADKISAPARLMLLFSQPSYDLCGGNILDRMNEVTGGLDIFGTITSTYPYDKEVCGIFYNGGFYTDRVAIVLLCGVLDVSFFAWRIPVERFGIKDILVTESKKNILLEFNNVPALTFLKDMGLVEGLDDIELLIIPICVLKPGGGHRTLVMQGIVDSDHVVCQAEIPPGSIISLGSISHDDVIASMKNLAKEIPDDNSGAIIFSCFVRSLVLGLDTEAETAYLAENLKNPFMFAYSGGEYCPVTENTGRRSNAFLNVSITACFFK